jgi:ABC-2 type transport system ATP-binding protein
MRADIVIELDGVTRQFERKSGRGLRRTSNVIAAVDAISLTVQRGEIVGWLGPNGAGKSTAIKMCTGILVPTSGVVRVLNLDPIAQRRKLTSHIGVVFGQRSQLWWDLPLHESFELLRRIHGVTSENFERRLTSLVEMLDLGSHLSVPVRVLSLGQRMRGELVAALIHGPEILFLDEPTIGLDVVSKHAMRQGLLDLRSNDDVTIVLTTHDLGDVRKLCDRVTVIDHGRVALDTDIAGLLALAGTMRTLVATFESDVSSTQSVLSTDGITVNSIDGPRASVDVDLALTSISQALERIGEIGRIVDLSVEDRDIEAVVRDLYLRNATRIPPVC